LIPGEHYVAYTSPKDLALQVDRLLRAPDEIERIRRSGATFIEQRILRHDWWADVSTALRDNPLVPAVVPDHRG
jgi:spore maturation protein CgeB